MRTILLDTNAYSHLFRGDEIVLNTLSKADVVYLSVVVGGELFAGFKGGTRERENIELLSRFAQKPTVQVLDITIETAEIFAQLKHNLKKSGTPIPINDI